MRRFAKTVAVFCLFTALLLSMVFIAVAVCAVIVLMTASFVSVFVDDVVTRACLTIVIFLLGAFALYGVKVVEDGGIR